MNARDLEKRLRERNTVYEAEDGQRSIRAKTNDEIYAERLEAADTLAVVQRENERLKDLHKASDSQFLSALMSTEEALLNEQAILAAVREERDRFAALAAEFEEVEPYLYQQAVNRLDRSDTDE